MRPIYAIPFIAGPSFLLGIFLVLAISRTGPAEPPPDLPPYDEANYRGHHYLIFKKTGELSFVHDPDCACSRKSDPRPGRADCLPPTNR